MADFGFKEQKFSFKKPWLFGEYEKMQQTIDEAEIYLGEGLVTVESQFKKPYNKLDHPTSENFFDGPGGTPLVPGQVPWGLPGNDCMPKGSAVGGGALNPCVPQLSCGQWAWTCAHRIKKFTAIGGWMQSVQYGANDSVTATACWDESHGGSTIIGVMVNTADGGVFQSKVPLNCLGPGHDNNCTSCLDCTGAAHEPVIHYTTQQMSINGTQQLSVSGGGGAPYKWSIIAGGGTIDQTGKYTAPATNVSCANNPTIKVTDFCGNLKTLKLAVNAVGVGTSGYYTGVVDNNVPPCGWRVRSQYYNCDGSTNGAPGGNFYACNGVATCNISCCMDNNVSCGLHPNCDGDCPGCGGGTRCCLAPQTSCSSANVQTYGTAGNFCGPGGAGCPKGCMTNVNYDLRGVACNNILVSGCCPVVFIT